MTEPLEPTPKKIDKKIIEYSVVAKDALAEMKAAVAPEQKTTSELNLEVMSSDWKRPHALPAQVYKIEKCPNSPDAAVYVTISHAVLNPGTEHETSVLAEIFINSKDVSHQQWITALTRTISAIFRKGGDVGFIVDELLGICDPGAGFLQRGVWHPSLVSQVGGVIKEHLGGLKRGEDWSCRGTETFRVESKGAVRNPSNVPKSIEDDEPDGNTDYPPNAELCPKCNHKAAILMDGCATCLNCGDSKCS